MRRRSPGGAMTRRPGPRPARPERGLVTVELAIGLIAAAMLTAMLVGVSMIGVTQAAVDESAAQLVRQAARGDDAAFEQAMDRTPPKADVTVRREADGVSASVTATVKIPWVGPFVVSGDAWAAYEPGVAP